MQQKYLACLWEDAWDAKFTSTWRRLSGGARSNETGKVAGWGRLIMLMFTVAAVPQAERTIISPHIDAVSL